MYSFVVKIALDVKRAVELVNATPLLGISIDNVEVVTADPDPNKISLLNNITFFLFIFLYFFTKFLINFRWF